MSGRPGGERSKLEFLLHRIRPLSFVAPLLCVAVYWHALNTWFQADDFAWLQLDSNLRGFGDLFDALFQPKAQGTIRVLSERLFFLVLKALFGPNALVFHAVLLLTQCVNLYFLDRLVTRWSGSRAAGLLAAVVWTLNPALVIPLSWASAYNQILCAFFLLIALDAWLRWIDTGQRRFAALMWIAYLLGFAALELMVVFPALALAAAPRAWKKTLPLWLPAVAFTILHLFVIPKSPSPIYKMYFDAALLPTALQYAAWAAGPSRFAEIGLDRWAAIGWVVTGLVGISLLAWTVFRALRRDWLPLFGLAWFWLLLAPVLPLKNHIQDYYLAIPSAGLAITAGVCLAQAWQGVRWQKAVALSIALLYAGGMLLEVQIVTRWYRTYTGELHRLVAAVVAERQRHPGRLILLNGVDAALFTAGFQDHAFAAFGIDRVYLTPSSEQALSGLSELADYRLGPAAIEEGKVTVLQVLPDRIQDVTPQYLAVQRATGAFSLRIPASDAAHLTGVHQLEDAWRWTSGSFAVRFASPRAAEARLTLHIHVPDAVTARLGAITLAIRIDGRDLPAERLPHAGDYSIERSAAVKAGEVLCEFRLDKTIPPSPQDARELGVQFLEAVLSAN